MNCILGNFRVWHHMFGVACESSSQGYSLDISTYDDGGEMEKYYWFRRVFPLE